MGKIKVWTIKTLVKTLLIRQSNEFDCNIAITGNRGDGKTTLASKLLFRFDCFNPWVHQVYNRDDVLNLLKTQRKGICFDDEAINSSYKREFQNAQQQQLIKIVTAYRDNFNLYFSVLPNFFSIDKELRDLYFLHIYVIKRGLAVILSPIKGRLYSQDRWDVKYNAKLEDSWNKARDRNPKFKPPYHKLHGFVAYLKFEKLTDNQRKLIDEVKKKKRSESFGEVKKETSFIDKVYNQLISGNLTKDGLSQICLMEGKKYSSINITLNRMLKDKGEKKTVKDFYEIAVNESIKDSEKQTLDLVPEV